MLALLLRPNLASGQSDTLGEVAIWDYHIAVHPSYKTEALNPDSGFFAADLGQLLGQKTAVLLKAYGGSGISTLSLRGANAAQTQVYWNGLQLNSPSLGLSDLSTLPSAAFDEVELQYGFASLQQGSGALGGSLHLQSNPWKKQAGLQAQLAGGSFGRYHGQVNGRYGGASWRGQTKVYRWQAQNNFRYPNITKTGRPEEKLKNARVLRQGLAQDLSLRISEKKLLSAHLWANQMARQLPAALTGNQNHYDSLLDAQLAMVLQYKQALPGGELLLSSGWHRANNDFFNGRDSSSHRNAFSSWQNQARYQKSWQQKWFLEMGLLMRLDRARSAAFSEQVERWQNSLFGELRYQANPKDHYQFLLRQALVDGNFNPLLFSLGYDRQWNTAWSTRLHLARNFRLPTLNDLYWQPGGNPALKPETSYNAEAALAWSGLGPYVPRLDLTVFYNQVNNWIQWQAQSSYWSPKNLKRVVQSGLEFKASKTMHWSRWQWDYTALYNYLRVYTLASSEKQAPNLGKQLAYVPFHQARLITGLRYRDWRMAYQWSYNGRYFVSADNQVYMPAYPLHQLMLSWNYAPEEQDFRWQFSLQLQNLSNRAYQVIPYRPEPGFHFFMQINYQWLP